MTRFQNMARRLAPICFFIVAAMPAARADSRRTSLGVQSNMIEPNAQKTLVASASLQNQESENAGSQPLKSDQLKKELEIEYVIGMTALRMKNWSRAIIAFEKIQEADPQFRDISRRLAQVRRGLSREDQETVVANYYDEGVSAMRLNDFGRALAAFEKIGELKSDYRDVDSLVTAIETMLQQKTAGAVLPTGAAADSLHVEKAAADSMRAASTGGRAFFYIGGAFAGLMMLAVLGFIGFSPATRARLHLLRGNPAAAALIYERLLQRHPERVKFYLPLANIYLNLGSRDERAMRAYKTVLYLNLVTRHREEINSIVAQKYLTEGRTDSDAIAVLEDALKTERRRLGQRQSRI